MKSPFSDRPPSGFYYSFRLSIHCINYSLFIFRKLYQGGTGRICIRYFYTRVNTSINTILRSTRLDKISWESKFSNITCQEKPPLYAARSYTRTYYYCRVYVRLSVLLANGLSASFRIIPQSIRRRSRPATIFDPIAGVYAGRVYMCPRTRRKKNTKINYDVVGEI